MATFGVEFTIGIPASVELTEEKVDKFYESLAPNFQLCSVDVAVDLDRGDLVALLGVDSPVGLDPEGFVTGVATDAVQRALRASGLMEEDDTAGLRPSARVLDFAA